VPQRQKQSLHQKKGERKTAETGKKQVMVLAVMITTVVVAAMVMSREQW